MNRILSLFAAALIVIASHQVAQAGNYALTSTVINNSGAYPFLPDFPATNVIDGQGVNNVQLGTVAQDQFGDSSTSGSSSYWLTPDGQGTNSFFTLDLGQPVLISQFRIANTRNTDHNDRGTQTFNVLGSNTIDSGHNLVSPTTLLAAQSLTHPTDQNNIPFDVFNPSGSSFGTFRYVEFQAITTLGGNGGLNEFQVIGTPEPASFVLCGLGAVGLLIASRRRRKV